MEDDGRLDLLSAWRTMLLIRRFEDKVQELFQSGSIQGSTHLCQGQEAVSVGACRAMRPGDVLTNTYRGHGEALALGMPLVNAFAELMGRANGCSGGVGGSMHLADFRRGNIGANAIVGAGMPIAVGAALAFQTQGRNNVALTFIGDGATNIGTFHEALNMAAVWSAPVIFVVVNNLYGEYSPIRATTPVDDLATRAIPYGIPGIVVDGQDVEAVHRVTREAIARARNGEGPSLLEMKTYRYRGHSRSDPARYRPAGELEAWKARDPITLLEDKLIRTGHVSANDAQTEREQIATEVDQASDEAATGPYPSMEDIHSHVYAD